MAETLTIETIQSVISNLPIQGRIMLRLLLLQYLDVTSEDIAYMAADRPDPRFVSGTRPLVPVVARDTIQSIRDRVAQYRTHTRQRREQLWLQIDCLRRQIAYGEALCAQGERLLETRFSLDPGIIRSLRAQARTAIAKPAIRELDQRWRTDEISEEEYRRKRLTIEYQAEVRKLDREQKRLQTALRDYEIVSRAPLQDHEIAHIWGIPAGTLAARKVKYLHQYLQGLSAIVSPMGQSQGDLWKETFAVLARLPIERSTVPYDGLDRTEASLMEKLTAFAMKTMPEDVESQAWAAISQSLFALQRLWAIQSERETTPEVLEQALLDRSAPPPKEALALPSQPRPSEPTTELDDWKEHILRSMRGEDRR